LTCREFGLLAPQMLKEFCRRKSCVNCRSYVFLTPSVLGTSCGGGGVNSGSRRDGGEGRRCLSRAPMGRRWRSGNDGQGRRRNGRDARSRRRTQNQGRGGVGMAMGSLVLGVVGRNLLMEKGGGRLRSRRRRRQRTRSSRISPTCGGKRQERIETMPRRGEDDPL
jgi:hypothetical protein